MINRYCTSKTIPKGRRRLDSTSGVVWESHHEWWGRLTALLAVSTLFLGCGDVITETKSTCYAVRIKGYAAHITVDCASEVQVKPVHNWWPPWYQRIAFFDGTCCYEPKPCDVSMEFLSDSLLTIRAVTKVGDLQLSLVTNLSAENKEIYDSKLGVLPWEGDTVRVTGDSDRLVTMTPYRSKTMEGTYYFLVHGVTWGTSVQGIILIGVESYSAVEADNTVRLKVKWNGIQETSELQFKVPQNSWEKIEIRELSPE